MASDTPVNTTFPQNELYTEQMARKINSEVPMSPVHKTNLPREKSQVLPHGGVTVGNHTGRTGV